MTKTEAIELVNAADDNDQLDDATMRDMFAALYDRQPDAQDEREGLWSHICAAI